MNEPKNEKIEKTIHRTNIQRILHTMCLFVPIIAAFSGFYFSSFFWHLTKDTTTPETFKFAVSIIFFAIPSILIFILTRNSNTIMKIKISG